MLCILVNTRQETELGRSASQTPSWDPLLIITPFIVAFCRNHFLDFLFLFFSLKCVSLDTSFILPLKTSFKSLLISRVISILFFFSLHLWFEKPESFTCRVASSVGVSNTRSLYSLVCPSFLPTSCKLRLDPVGQEVCSDPGLVALAGLQKCCVLSSGAGTSCDVGSYCSVMPRSANSLVVSNWWYSNFLSAPIGMLLYRDAFPHLLFVYPVVQFLSKKDKCIIISLPSEVMKAYKVDQFFLTIIVNSWT